MMHKLVSVIVPFYDDADFLGETLHSISEQTYKHVEVIVIDDGSTCLRTKGIVDNLREKYRFELVLKENGGPSSARNFGIFRSNGEYILPLDADDLIHPEYIQKSVEILEANSSIGFVYCRAEFIGEKSGLWDLPDFNVEEFAWDNLIFNAGVFRKESWIKYNGYDESLIWGSEDYDFWLNFVADGYLPYRIPEVLFFYRIKQVSRSTQFASSSIEKKVQTYTKIYLNHLEFFEKNMSSILRKKNKLVAFAELRLSDSHNKKMGV